MARKNQNYRRATLLLILATLLIAGTDLKFAMASGRLDSIPTAPVDGWEVEGMHGDIHVEGSLTESPCHLSMESAEQSVSLGTIPRYRLRRMGDHSPAVAVHLQLQDCGMASNHLRDNAHEESDYQLPDQLVSLLTIEGVESPDNLHLLKVNGDVKGVALRLEDPQHHQLVPGEHSRGLIMNQGNTDLVLYAMLERTEQPLIEGQFNVLMNFTLGYH